MTEWFEGRSIDEQLERCYWRRVGFVVVFAAILAALLFPLLAHSEPLFQTSGEGITITLHSEACALKEVTNLPRRATWDEKGKTFEGCWRLSQSGYVLFYFLEDKTVGDAPAQVFKKVVGV